MSRGDASEEDRVRGVGERVQLKRPGGVTGHVHGPPLGAVGMHSMVALRKVLYCCGTFLDTPLRSNSHASPCCWPNIRQSLVKDQVCECGWYRLLNCHPCMQFPLLLFLCRLGCFWVVVALYTIQCTNCNCACGR